MNMAVLKLELKKRGLSIPKLAKLVDIGEKSLYNKINEKTQFTQQDILKIVAVLQLNKEMIVSIFFS